MALPPFAAYPPVNLQNGILPEEWEICLDSWLFLAHGHLVLPLKEFSLNVAKDHSLIHFLISYMRETSISTNEPAKLNAKVRSLRRECFLLTHRILLEVQPIPPLLLEWTFLGDLSVIFARNSSLKSLLKIVWDREALDSNLSLQKAKANLIQVLEASNKEPNETSLDIEKVLWRTGALLKSSYQYGQFLMLGSDLIDSISTAYEEGSPSMQRRLIAMIYLSLMSLMEPTKPKFSTLLDHLYSLNAASHYDSLLSGLCSKTRFVQKLRDRLSGAEAERAKPLVEQLSGFERTKSLPLRPKKLTSRRIDKGKDRDRDEYGHGAFGSVHIHKMSLVTQIQDLFADLGSGFVVKLLDQYDDDVEQVTAHLLDDSLPPHLQNADRAENISGLSAPTFNLSPRATPPLSPTTRRNRHDNDAFDLLAVSPSSLHLGRKNPSQTADTILSSPTTRPAKAAILAALAAFDSDDDERDDTYDVSDVGGTVDTSAGIGPGEDPNNVRDVNEEALFAAYKIGSEVFERDAGTRRGSARKALKTETGMTDEAIEGWAIMLNRDPKRLRGLEARFSTFGGGQRELAATAYRQSPAGSGTEDSDAGASGGRGGFGGRDRGDFRGRRGRGGAGSRGGGAGPSEDGGSMQQRRDNANKGQRANHNRRDQRAKKMARGGFAG